MEYSKVFCVSNINILSSQIGGYGHYESLCHWKFNFPMTRSVSLFVGRSVGLSQILYRVGNYTSRLSSEHLFSYVAKRKSLRMCTYPIRMIANGFTFSQLEDIKFKYCSDECIARIQGV